MTVHTRGRFFGEVALLLDMPHFTDAQTRTDCRLLRYSKEQFWSMMRFCPSVAREILRTTVMRVRGMEGFSQQREKRSLSVLHCARFVLKNLARSRNNQNE